LLIIATYTYFEHFWAIFLYLCLISIQAEDFFSLKNRVRKEKTCAENLANRNSRREFRTKLEIFPKK